MPQSPRSAAVNDAMVAIARKRAHPIVRLLAAGKKIIIFLRSRIRIGTQNTCRFKRVPGRR